MKNETPVSQRLPEIAVIGFGGCGFNNIISFPVDSSRDMLIMAIGEKEEKNCIHEINKNIAFFSFEEFELAIEKMQGIRLCILIGGAGGNSCKHLSIFAKNLRERGVMTVAFVTLPFKFEMGEKESLSALEMLEKELDAYLLFPNEVAMQKFAGKANMSLILETIVQNMYSCIKSMKISSDNLISFDWADLRTFLHGPILFGIGLSEDISIAVRNAVNQLREKVEDGKNIANLLLFMDIPESLALSAAFAACQATLDDDFIEHSIYLVGARSHRHKEAEAVLLGNFNNNSKA